MLIRGFVAVVALLVTAAPVAAACYGVNEGAWGSELALRRGIKGEIDLTAATPLAGAAIAHPIQVSTTGGDFLGWGTAKGKGIDQCPDYFGDRWQVYIDGSISGVYFCIQPFDSTAPSAQDQFFRIEYTACQGYPGHLRWVFFWNAVQRACKTTPFSLGYTSAGSESVDTSTTQNLRVAYPYVQVRQVLLPTWDTGSQLETCEMDAPYEVWWSVLSAWKVEQ